MIPHLHRHGKKSTRTDPVPGPQENQEQFEPDKHISDEEKKLVESMTRFMDSMASEHFEDDDE